MFDKNDGCEHKTLKGTTQSLKWNGEFPYGYGYLYSSYHRFLGNKLISSCILPLCNNEVNIVTV